MKSTLGGLSGSSRKRLGKVLNRAQIITVTTAVEALGLNRKAAAKLLSGWAQRGWLSRVGRGIYVPISLDAKTTEQGIEEPWVIAQQLYEPCYIAGLSAAEHWDFTEQIFNSLFVVTGKPINKRRRSFGSLRLVIKSVPQKFIFGTQGIWFRKVKVQVSDPSRTVVDLLADPRMGGGIRTVFDIVKEYFKSPHCDPKLLVNHAVQLDNSSVFKRLGFFLEKHLPKETGLIKICRSKLKTGYSQLDPSSPSKKLATSWNLWVPEAFLRTSDD